MVKITIFNLENGSIGMVVIVVITAFFWSFLIVNSLTADKAIADFKRLLWWLAINVIIGWGVYWLLARYLHLKVVMIVTGLFIIVSGFRWLGIWSKDFFSLFERLTFLEFSRISGSYAIYFTGLAAMAQLSAMGVKLNGLSWILVTNFLLAGFLLLLLRIKRKLLEHKWIGPLMFVESGIYLTVMGLVIMGGDVPYFVLGIAKILHI